ncbi:MAG TPA: hypothetical protein VMR06_08230 [Dokdonella sp.]|uniref:hypothetical protein n=1 Tax=Dokdonella sp. TaxID=2291710 RepID=UPI002CCDA47D|nr:hypothetical protein [Dokdonella sp.]HUD41970.1 hypothetical protein [Dokdonella sp.]
MTLAEIAKGVADVVREHVSRAFGPLAIRIGSLERRLDALEREAGEQRTTAKRVGRWTGDRWDERHGA